MNELVKFDGKKSVGIKEVKVIRRVSPESFTKCGTFSRRDIKKEYRPGRGIVQSVIDTIVYFDCLHQATPESLGGMCWLGTAVCRQCLIMCFEPGCGRDVCRASHCNCGGMRDGRVYCTKHLNTGIMGFLSVLFE